MAREFWSLLGRVKFVAAVLMAMVILAAVLRDLPALRVVIAVVALALGLVMLVFFALAYARWSLREWAATLNRVSPLLPLATFLLTLLLVGTFGSRAGSTRFHEVSAQIIPLLLLALAVEARAFQLTRFREPAPLFVSLATLAFLGLGEFYALRVLYCGGQPSDGDLVAAAIAAGFAGVAVLALLGPSSSEAVETASPIDPEGEAPGRNAPDAGSDDNCVEEENDD